MEEYSTNGVALDWAEKHFRIDKDHYFGCAECENTFSIEEMRKQTLHKCLDGKDKLP